MNILKRYFVFICALVVITGSYFYLAHRSIPENQSQPTSGVTLSANSLDQTTTITMRNVASNISFQVVKELAAAPKESSQFTAVCSEKNLQKLIEKDINDQLIASLTNSKKVSIGDSLPKSLLQPIVQRAYASSSVTGLPFETRLEWEYQNENCAKAHVSGNVNLSVWQNNFSFITHTTIHATLDYTYLDDDCKEKQYTDKYDEDSWVTITIDQSKECWDSKNNMPFPDDDLGCIHSGNYSDKQPTLTSYKLLNQGSSPVNEDVGSLVGCRRCDRTPAPSSTSTPTTSPPSYSPSPSIIPTSSFLPTPTSTPTSTHSPTPSPTVNPISTSSPTPSPLPSPTATTSPTPTTSPTSYSSSTPTAYYSVSNPSPKPSTNSMKNETIWQKITSFFKYLF